MNDNYDVPYNAEGDTYIKARIAQLLRNLRFYLENEGKTDFKTRNILTHVLNSNKLVTELPDSEYKEELLLILFYDMEDVLSTAQGLNLSPDRVNNYKAKVLSLNKLLDFKGNGIYLNNVKGLLSDIQSKMEECLQETHAIDPNTWFLIQTFINNLFDHILMDSDEVLKEHSAIA